MTSDQELRELANDLKRMPFYQFFLAGRELFHSNFLAWLFEQMPDAIVGLFFDDEPKIRNVRREKKNIDLWVEFEDGRQLVIENKFKSLVDDEQLERYGHAIGISSGKISHVVLSPDSGQVHVGEKLWRRVTYRDLIKHLRGSSNHMYITDYCDMVDATLKFMDCIRENDKIGNRAFWFDDEAFKSQDAIAESIRIHDLLQKRRAQHLALEVDKRLSGTLDGKSLHVASGFTRKKPLVEAFLDVDGSELAIGIQVQENQFRRCLLVRRAIQKKNKRSVVRQGDFERLQGSWFRSNPQEQFQGGYFHLRPEVAMPAKKQGLQQSFGDVFKYQYVKIGGGLLAPAELIDAIAKELEFAGTLTNHWPL